MTSCQIVFDKNDHGTFFTGQIVSGKVIIELNRKKKLRGKFLRHETNFCPQFSIFNSEIKLDIFFVVCCQ